MGNKEGKSVAQFFIELGMLKRMPRSGWIQAGVQNPESVAGHSYRTAMIAWALAKFRKADTDKVVKMALLHDIEEARTGDLNIVNKKYHLNGKKAKAYSDVLINSPFAAEALALIAELGEQKTIEAKLVKEADRLELFAQAFEYAQAGVKGAEKFMHSSRADMKLKSTKDMAKQIEKEDLVWWYK